MLYMITYFSTQKPSTVWYILRVNENDIILPPKYNATVIHFHRISFHTHVTMKYIYYAVWQLYHHDNLANSDLWYIKIYAKVTYTPEGVRCT